MMWKTEELLVVKNGGQKLRRILVLVTSIVLYVTLFGRPPRAAAEMKDQENDVKIGYRTQAYGRMGFGEALRDLKERGYGGVEFCLDSPPVRGMAFDEAAAKKFAKMISDAGLEVYSVSHHGNFVSNDRFFDELKRLIPLARAMGTEMFVISSGPIDRENRRRQFVTVEKRLRELTEVAEKAGVTLALEAEPNLAVESTRELMQLIWKIESPALRINLDIGHAYLTDDDLTEIIRKAAKLIVHAHIDDMAGGVHKHLLPGTGEIDLPEVMTAFLEIGFRGPFVVDLFNLDPKKAATPAMKEIKRSLDIAQEKVAAWPEIVASRFDLSKAYKSHHGTVYAMDPVPKGAHPPFNSAWGYLEPGEEMELHSHPTEEIYLVFKGTGVVIVGPREKEVTVGDVIFVPPNQMHTMSNRSNAPLLWMAVWWTAPKAEE
jgi:sugar phosphate isomerase/epimerase/mannose-6-phosphate isomerase-like protein (cupin superfamily)